MDERHIAVSVPAAADRIISTVWRRKGVLGACAISVVLSACGGGGSQFEGGVTGSQGLESSAPDAKGGATVGVASSPTTKPASPIVQPPSDVASATSSNARGTPASEAGATTAANWVDTLISDMKWFHDAPSAVLETIPGWGSGANYPEATQRPAGWKIAIPWSHTMRDTSAIRASDSQRPWREKGPYTGNDAPNTRIQQRDIQMWWLLSNGQWVLGSHSSQPGANMYPMNWSEGSDINARELWRDESSNGGGASMRSVSRDGYINHLWHTWASPHEIPANAIGAATAYFSRLILDNPNGPDDRHLAHILSAGAGDWYKDQATISAFKVQGQNVTYMGFGRLKYVTKDWQLFGWTSLSEAQIRANPPPFIGLPK
ncbi:MAG: hypothetical protein M9885_12915 [Burkholderiaceae bacterium]|nr:hypothetical protein [Burkholderiaceae bacterium]